MLGRILAIAFAICALTILVGYLGFIEQGDAATGKLLVGSGVALIALVIMPVFIWYRWKDKNLMDYTLHPDNVKKHRAKLDEISRKEREELEKKQRDRFSQN